MSFFYCASFASSKHRSSRANHIQYRAQRISGGSIKSAMLKFFSFFLLDWKFPFFSLKAMLYRGTTQKNYKLFTSLWWRARAIFFLCFFFMSYIASYATDQHIFSLFFGWKKGEIVVGNLNFWLEQSLNCQLEFKYVLSLWFC